jgi:hypothetical protein
MEAQMRAAHRPVAPSRITTGPRFGAMPSRAGGFRLGAPRWFGQHRPWFNPAFRHHRFHFFFGNSCFSGAFFDPFFCNQFFFRSPFFSAQPVFWPYPVYSAPYYPIAEQAPATMVDREGDLATEIDQLKDEVARLREEEASREQARQAASQPPPPVAENIPTILIFHDGRRSEVRNYAIVGQTLWALTEQRSHKIPISDLDIEATKKANADRGVEIRLP